MKYKQKYNQVPDFFAANAYDALKIIVQAIEKDSNTSDGIKNALYSTKNYPGVGSNITFDSNGEVIKPVRIKIIKSDQFVPYENQANESF